MEGSYWGFDELPLEIKLLIFSFTDLNIMDVVRAQAVSTEFKTLCWDQVYSFSILAVPPNERNRVIESFKELSNPHLITRINFSLWPNPIESAVALIDKFTNLKEIHFDFHAESRELRVLRSHQAKFEQHSKLVQISYGGGCWDRRWVQNRKFFQNTEEFQSGSQVLLEKKYNCGGTIGDNMIVIGADSTLKFFTLRRNYDSYCEMVFYSTNNITHKGSINGIWSNVPKDHKQTHAYIASSDGNVSNWHCEDNNPVLKNVYSFPESILFVSQFADRYLLAAGKRTLYITELGTDRYFRCIDIEDDITGLYSNDSKCNLSTANGIYMLEESSFWEETLQKVVDVTCPNMCFNSDASLRMTVHPTTIEVCNVKTNSIEVVFTVEEQFPFDTSPNSSKFHSTSSWVTVSDYKYVFIFDLNGGCIARLRRDQHIVSFWYSTCGNFLFVLMSNDRIYCWYNYQSRERI